MVPEVEIATELLARLWVAAAASPYAEVCGLLFGDGTRVENARACRNVHADPARRFEIDAAALLHAHREQRRGGPRVIGHYHSHPSGVAVPSVADAEAAAPDGAVWLIITAGDARAWRAVANGALHGRFDPLRIVPPGLRG